MASRTIADVPLTPATIALNAYIYGYGGHSLVTPHAALKRLWWTEDRIQAKVTRAFVLSKLRGQEREFLDQVVGFGENAGVIEGPSELDDGEESLDGLTTATYMDWILTRAKRLFLILTDIGVPDQIFGCIDDLWDDYDLPLALEDVKNLELTIDGDPALDQKFYETQFVYLLRELKAGAHIDYDEREHIPVEHVDKVPPAVTVQEYGGRVHFPGRPDEVFMRRKIVLKTKGSADSDVELFRQEVLKAQSLPHPHIAPAWASYTSGDAGFLMSDFVAEHTLATFIDHRTPPSFTRLTPRRRIELLWEWMRCLADALSYMHDNDEPHTAICPSNIWIDKDNNIAFADLGQLRTLQKAKKIQRTELYDYAAPETPLVAAMQPTIFRDPTLPRVAEGIKKLQTDGETDSGPHQTDQGSELRRSPSFSGSAVTPLLHSDTTSSPQRRPTSSGHGTRPHSRNFSRPLVPLLTDSSVTSMRPASPAESFASSHPFSTIARLLPEIPTPTPQMSDIFSLACIYLNIITFMLEGKITDFVKFRSYTLNIFKQRRYRADSSFHSDPDIIRDWITHLEKIWAVKVVADKAAKPEQVDVLRGVPEMLRLIRSMMTYNAMLRPTAQEVHTQISSILQDECHMSTLGCEACKRARHAERPQEQGLDTAIDDYLPALITRKEQIPNLTGTASATQGKSMESHRLTTGARPRQTSLERPISSYAIITGSSASVGASCSGTVPSDKLERMQVKDNSLPVQPNKKKGSLAGLRSFRTVFHRSPRTVQAV